MQHVLPLRARLLVNYDLPTSKEEHNRRLATILGGSGADFAQGAAIHFVVAGQIGTFRSLEKMANAAIHEMPVHAAEILGPSS
jgi:superfamily II DNA/RNA helicase